MKYSIYKNVSGKFNRYKVKVFKTSDSMHNFLNKGTNALFWKRCKGENLPKKGGTYFTSGLESRWINEKELIV